MYKEGELNSHLLKKWEMMDAINGLYICSFSPFGLFKALWLLLFPLFLWALVLIAQV